MRERRGDGMACVFRQILPPHVFYEKICTFMFINISPSDGIMIDKKVNGGKISMWTSLCVWSVV